MICYVYESNILCCYSAFVMDSLSPALLMPYSKTAVENINTLLRCWYPNMKLNAVPYQVCTFSVIQAVTFQIVQVPMQQGSVDCGVHVMTHIQRVTNIQV